MSNQNGEAPDPVDAAISATEQGPPIQMTQLQVTISSTGRPFIVAFPVDVSDGELAEAVGWLLSTVLQGIRAERAKTPIGRILVPGPSGLIATR